MEAGTTHNTRYETISTWVFFFCWGFVFLDRLSISFLLPIIQPEMGITNTQVGLFGFVTTGAYAVSAIIFGALADRSGFRKRWLIIFMLITGVSTGACALTQTFGQLLVVRGIVGLGEGPLWALMSSMLIRSSRSNTFGRNAGIVNCGVGLIAVTLGPILVTQLVAYVSWQLTFLLSSLPTFLMVAVVWKLIEEIKVESGSDFQNEELQKTSRFGTLFANKNIMVCVLISIFSMVGYWTLSLYAPLYLVNVAGLSVQQMGFVSAVMGILYIVYSFLVPKLSDNFGRKPALIFFYFLCIMAPLAMAIFPGSMIAVYVYMIFGGVPGAMTPVVASVIPLETVADNLRATAQGLVNGVGEVLGGSLGPVLVGKVADVYGLYLTMGIGAAAFVIDLTLSCFLQESNQYVIEKKAKAKSSAAA
ncbi:MAG: MFS transporter [Gracilibacteraceae bacterium]|nr:MFS transporter [Gracilibacteraceae bacterium]